MPHLVARRVAETDVDAVGLLLRLPLELDAAVLELFVARLHVVSREEEAARGSLRQHLLHLRLGVGVEHGRAGNGQQRQPDVLPRQADREPAEVAHLGHGHVLAELESQLVGVEGEGFVLIVDPHTDVGDALEHVFLLCCRLRSS